MDRWTSHAAGEGGLMQKRLESEPGMSRNAEYSSVKTLGDGKKGILRY